MKGTMLIVSPSGSIKTSPLTRPPETEEVQSAVGGWIEQVPHLTTIEYRGTVYPCVAFTNEEGKLKGLPQNHAANRLWDAALKRSGNTDARRRIGAMARMVSGQPPLDEEDFLVGNLVIIFGDRELMKEL